MNIKLCIIIILAMLLTHNLITQILEIKYLKIVIKNKNKDEINDFWEVKEDE